MDNWDLKLSYTLNIMAVDDLATQGARASQGSKFHSSEMSEKDSRTSGIPEGLVRRMTAYFCIGIGFIYFRQMNGTFE